MNAYKGVTPHFSFRHNSHFEDEQVIPLVKVGVIYSLIVFHHHFSLFLFHHLFLSRFSIPDSGVNFEG